MSTVIYRTLRPIACGDKFYGANVEVEMDTEKAKVFIQSGALEPIDTTAKKKEAAKVKLEPAAATSGGEQ